jgi:hypothetical protein
LNWIWKSLIVLSLAMNLAGFGTQTLIVDKTLAELWAQVAAFQSLSTDQQALRRQVIELEKSCEAAFESPH